MSFFTAVRFMTIFPTPSSGEDDPKQIGRAAPYFPIIGLIIGMILARLYNLFQLAFPIPIAGALLLTSLVIITGAHHLDGLIDTCDAMAAGKTKGQRLLIMSDTRVGAFGIAGAVLILILKYAAILGSAGTATLVIFPLVSRWTLCSAIIIFPSAKNEGAGFAVKQGADLKGFIFATLITALIMVLLTGLVTGLAIMVSLFAMICCLGLLMTRLFGGLTGDCYGALVEIGEVLTILAAIVLIPLVHNIPGYDFLRLPFLTW